MQSSILGNIYKHDNLGLGTIQTSLWVVEASTQIFLLNGGQVFASSGGEGRFCQTLI